MKFKHLLWMAFALLAVASCKYDDDDLWSAVNDHEERISALETWQKQANENIAALQQLVSTMDYITSVTPVTENGEEIGYRIEFKLSEPITIYHGVDAEVSLNQDEDGNWYWTLNGETLTDAEGNPIRANALKPSLELGKDLLEGAVINDEPEGAKPEQGAVYLTIDEGKTWTKVSGPKGDTGATGPAGSTGATGPEGKPGADNQGIDVEVKDTYVEFILEDGTKFRVPLEKGEFKIGTDDNNEALQIQKSGETVALKFPVGLTKEEVTGIIAEVIGKSENSNIVTRSSNYPVSVKAINTEASILDAELQITYTEEVQTGDTYMIRATLVYADGSTLVTARAITLTAPPKIGDIYYSDGSYSTNLITGKTPVGIIFYLTAKDEDNRLANTAEAEALGRTPTGLVLALKNATWAENVVIDNSKSLALTNYPEWEDFPRYEYDDYFCWNSFIADKDKLPNGKDGWVQRKFDEDVPNLTFDENVGTACYNDFSGLRNCQIIETSGNLGELSNYPAFYAAKLYNKDNVRPQNSTEWFLPSSGQWMEIIRSLGHVNIGKNLENCTLIKDNSMGLTTSDAGSRPSRPDCFDGCAIENMNSYLEKVGKGKYTPFKTSTQSTGYFERFWTSTEVQKTPFNSTVYKNDNHAVYAYIGTMDSGTNHSISISVQDKNYFNHNSGVNGSNATLHVRCILAF